MVPDDDLDDGEIDIGEEEEFEVEIDLDDDEAEPVYEWTSFNGCEICDAMAGKHVGYEPERPHPYCECEIALVSANENASSIPGTCFAPVTINYKYILFYPGSSTASLHAEYEIRCLDRDENEVMGESGEESADFEIGVVAGEVSQSELFSRLYGNKAEAQEEIREKVEARAEEVCRGSCRSEPNS